MTVLLVREGGGQKAIMYLSRERGVVMEPSMADHEQVLIV